jgi:hypothetical protein
LSYSPVVIWKVRSVIIWVWTCIIVFGSVSRIEIEEPGRCVIVISIERSSDSTTQTWREGPTRKPFTITIDYTVWCRISSTCVCTIFKKNRTRGYRGLRSARQTKERKNVWERV